MTEEQLNEAERELEQRLRVLREVRGGVTIRSFRDFGLGGNEEQEVEEGEGTDFVSDIMNNMGAYFD